MSAAYDDDRPGMMRIHIAERRGDALCKAYSRMYLRTLAKQHGVDVGLGKRDLAFYLAVEGVTAPGYDKASER